MGCSTIEEECKDYVDLQPGLTYLKGKYGSAPHGNPIATETR
jgi:hypothetical protein